MTEETCWIMQSRAMPEEKLKPEPGRGYCILVIKKPCKYGINCNRKCWSVGTYPGGGHVDSCKKGPGERGYGKGGHEKVHWHLAHNAKWTNGVEVLDFKVH